MNAILAGILQGAGLSGQALAQQRKEAEDRALRESQVDLTRQQMQQTHDLETRKMTQQQGQFEASRFAKMPVALLPKEYAAQADPSGFVSVEASQVPGLMARGLDDLKAAREQTKVDSLRGMIRANRSGYGVEPPSEADVIGASVGVPGADKLMEYLYPKEKNTVHSLTPGTIAITGTGQKIGENPRQIMSLEDARKIGTGAPPGTQAHYRNDPDKGWTVEFQPLPQPHQTPQPNQPAMMQAAIQRFQQLRDDPKFGPTHPATLNAKEVVAGLGQVVGVPDLGAVPKSNFLSPTPYGTPPPSAQPRVPGAAPQPGPNIIPVPPKRPPAKETEQLSKLDAVNTMISGTLSKIETDPEIKAILGWGGAANRGLTNIGVPGFQSEKQAKFRSEMALATTSVRQTLEGMRNEASARGIQLLLPAMPGENEPLATQAGKLQGIQAWLKANRASLENTLSQLQYRVPAAPGATAPGMSPADAKAAAQYGL